MNFTVVIFKLNDFSSLSPRLSSLKEVQILSTDMAGKQRDSVTLLILEVISRKAKKEVRHRFAF